MIYIQENTFLNDEFWTTGAVVDWVRIIKMQVLLRIVLVFSTFILVFQN